MATIDEMSPKRRKFFGNFAALAAAPLVIASPGAKAEALSERAAETSIDVSTDIGYQAVVWGKDGSLGYWGKDGTWKSVEMNSRK